MPDQRFREKLARRADLVDLHISDATLASLETYFQLLQKWNRRISLTSLPLDDVTDEALDRLFLEPLRAVAHLPPAARIIDIGSGGGSPAIPLRIGASGGGSLVMVESRSRKASFLRDTVRQLELASVTVETARFEDLVGRSEFEGAANVVTVRAVRIEEKTLRALRSFLTPEGYIFLFTRGEDSTFVTAGLQEAGRFSLVESNGSSLVILKATG